MEQKIMIPEPAFVTGQPVYVADVPYNISGLSPNRGSWIYTIRNSDAEITDIPESIIEPRRYDMPREDFRAFFEVVK
jgi:hypothetical protein